MGILFERIEVIVGGQVHRLDGNEPYAYLGHDGLGAAPRRRLSERGPQQNGDTDLGYRLDPRVFSLALQIEAGNASDYWDEREALIGWFAPYNALTLAFALRNGRSRHIDCHLVGDLTMPDDDYRGTIQRVGLQFKANDPTFYDPAGVAVTFSLGGGGDAFPVPHEVPHGVGASTIDQTTAVTNGGNWLALPHLIRITGPIEDCVITNERTGEKLDFTGTTIAGDDYYDVDCRYGRKTVVDSEGVNRIADLTSDSDLATWHLEPGINSVRVTGEGVTEETGVAINYLERYLGI